jgi:hypothetical protein
LSALLLLRVHVPQTRAVDDGGGMAALRAGLGYALRTPLVRVVFVVTGMAMFAASLKQPLEPVFVLRNLDGAARDIGIAAAAWDLG